MQNFGVWLCQTIILKLFDMQKLRGVNMGIDFNSEVKNIHWKQDKFPGIKKKKPKCINTP